MRGRGRAWAEYSQATPSLRTLGLHGSDTTDILGCVGPAACRTPQCGLYFISNRAHIAVHACHLWSNRYRVERSGLYVYPFRVGLRVLRRPFLPSLPHSVAAAAAAFLARRQPLFRPLLRSVPHVSHCKDLRDGVADFNCSIEILISGNLALGAHFGKSNQNGVACLLLSLPNNVAFSWCLPLAAIHKGRPHEGGKLAQKKT